MFQNFIQAGIKLLNERKPGWYRQINLNALNINDCEWCILGQLYGEYLQGIRTLGTTYNYAPLYGFSLAYASSSYDWEIITMEWRVAILELRAKEKQEQALQIIVIPTTSAVLTMPDILSNAARKSILKAFSSPPIEERELCCV